MVPLADAAVSFNLRFLNNIYKKNTSDDSFVFQPEEISLEDDAFQGVENSRLLHFTEWWYFDSIFDNGYSIQTAVRLICLFGLEVVGISRLDIYKDGDLLYHKRNVHLMGEIEISEARPDIKINGEQVVKGYIDDLTGKWIYDIFFDMDDTSVDLHLVGQTCGYKGDVPGSEWTVVLPRANVTGTIRLNDESIEVEGTGYHDHNYEVGLPSLDNFGWYWGRISTENYTINWAEILKTRMDGYKICVISEKNGGYTNIMPEDIRIVVANYTISNLYMIPTTIFLNVDAENIKIQVKMDFPDIHHCRLMGLMNYWRYHMGCDGYITVGSQTEIIEGISICEFLRFNIF